LVRQSLYVPVRKALSRHVTITPVLVLLAFVITLAMPVFAWAEPTATLEITGEGVANPFILTRSELEAMEPYEHVYSAINTWPTKRWYVARGVKLRQLLAQAQIKDEATLVRFISSDGYDVTLTVKELLKDKRYYFPGLKDNHPSDGSIPGSTEGAQEVEPILALVSAEGSDDPATMNDRDALLLVIGQRAVTEQTNNLFLKYVSKIEVLTAEPEKWDSPKANIPSGMEVPVGTEIELSNKHNNEDKIYYTTDGSTPTVNSPMFNWSASRWWDQRNDVKSVNKAIEVKENTVIKMITIGPGKEDSEVVTFTFTADMTGKAVDPTKVPGGPPTGVTLDRNAIDRPIGSTFQLEANLAPFNATDQDVIWSSSDTRVATVDNRGLVTVVGPGTAIITVTTVVGGHTATCIVNGPDEDADSEEAAMTAADTGENQMAEPPNKLSSEEAEPPQLTGENETAAGSNTSSRDTEATTVPPVPEDRAQYLAKIKDLAASVTENAQQPGSEAWQVYELSADTIPLPLQEEHDIFTGALFLFLLFSGAGKRYAEYAKER
jgi:hypothetical protein